MTFHMPPLRVSPNVLYDKTVSVETGRKNPGEPNFRGHWVVRDQHGTFIDCYEFMRSVKQFHPEAVRVPNVDHSLLRQERPDEFPGYRS